MKDLYLSAEPKLSSIRSKQSGASIDWNRICKSLVYANERLAEMYAEVYAKDLGEWPGEVDADLVGESDRRGLGRARKGKFGEQALWWGLYQIYGSVNFAWKVCDTGLNDRKRIGICHFHEFPVGGECAKLLPDGECDDAGQVRLDDRQRDGSRDRPGSKPLTSRRGTGWTQLSRRQESSSIERNSANHVTNRNQNNQSDEIIAKY